MIIYLKALWKLTYHQALFDSLERHTRKPFKSQLSDLLCLDEVLSPRCFQDTAHRLCWGQDVHSSGSTMGNRSGTDCTRQRAGRLWQASSTDSCQDSPALLEPLYSCQMPTPMPAVPRSLHALPVLPLRAAQGQTQLMTTVARAGHKLGQVWFGGSLFVPL